MRRDEDVGRLEVAVDDALGVRRGERVGQREADLDERRAGPAGPRSEALVERLAVEQLHHEERAPATCRRRRSSRCRDD